MFEEAIKALQSYKELDPNWDGHGASVPNSRCMDKAIEFLEALAAANLSVRAPQTTLTSHATEVYWARTGSLLSITFDSENDEMEIYAICLENSRLIWSYEGTDDILALIKSLSKFPWLDNL